MTESSLPLQFPVWAFGWMEAVTDRTCRCDPHHASGALRKKNLRGLGNYFLNMLISQLRRAVPLAEANFG